MSQKRRSMRLSGVIPANRVMFSRPTTGHCAPTDGIGASTKLHQLGLFLMNHRIAARFGALFLAAMLGTTLLGASAPADAADDFLDPEVAFKVAVAGTSDGKIEVRVVAADGYYLYDERFAAEASEPGIRLGPITRPAGHVKYDRTFAREVVTHRGELMLTVPVLAAPERFNLQLGLQGCADAGLCYSPMTIDLPVVLLAAINGSVAGPGPGSGAVIAGASAGSIAGSSTESSAGPQASFADAGEGIFDGNLSRIRTTLATGSLVTIAGVFLVLGLLLSFTPCVLPMVPILSSIIVGQRQPVTRSRGFALALAYSLGMALVYTAVGVAAGLAGEGLAAALQKPWVLALFASLLVALALSMFDVYQLEMPRSIQDRANGVAARLPGGRFAGVFTMGAVSALVVGPCVAAPLAGALVYISQTRDVVIGGTALFAMAMGMSVPLLLIGLSARNLVPKSGAWMIVVKRLFGVLLIGTAIWLLSPAIPVWLQMLAWSVLLIVAASFLRVFDPLGPDATGWLRFGKGLGVVIAAMGLMQLVGAASGAQDILQPLQAVSNRGGLDPTGSGTPGQPRFERVSSLEELERRISASGRPVMLDVSAEWCVSCKEMERFTFADRQVAERMKQLTLLKFDVTHNSDADKAMLRRFGLFGPPGILMFGADGRERVDARVIGYQPPAEFLRRLQRLLGA